MPLLLAALCATAAVLSAPLVGNEALRGDPPRPKCPGRKAAMQATTWDIADIKKHGFGSDQHRSRYRGAERLATPSDIDTAAEADHWTGTWSRSRAAHASRLAAPPQSTVRVRKFTQALKCSAV